MMVLSCFCNRKLEATLAIVRGIVSTGNEGWEGIDDKWISCCCRIVAVGRKAMGEMAVPMQGTETRLGA